MPHPQSFSFGFVPGRLSRLFRLCAAFALAATAAFSVEDARKSFDVPAGPAERSLKQFAEQSGHGVIFVTGVVQGVQTQAVRGELPVREALDRMLADTGLVATQDAKTGAFAVKRDPNPNAGGAAPAKPSDRPGSDVKVEGSMLKLETFTVTGSNLRAGESTGGANLRVATSTEIEQSGVGSVSAFLKKIPEIGAGGFGENRVNTSSPGTAAASLRGLGANSTLVLLNGRRLAPAPFAQGGSAAALGTIQFVDLNMIPVDAIARVEVLKDGASAIYGADAVAGVVNLVLKDNLQGSVVRASYGDFPGGIAASTTKFSAYTGVTAGKLKLFALANYLHQENIQYGELAPKAVALSNGSNPGTFIVPVGGINPITGAVIPVGTAAAARTFTVDTSAAGFNTTPATAPQNRYNINAELTPQPRVTRAGALLTAGYELTRGLSAYAEVNYQRNTNLEFLSASPITNLNTVVLPANAVYNPFDVDVVNSPTAGANLIYRFTEAGPRATKTTSEFYRLVGGLKGGFGDTWSWDASLLYNRATSHNDLVSGWISQAAVNTALADPIAATALNLFTNGTTVKNNPATLEKLKSDGTRDAYTELTSLGAKTTGVIGELPAGAIDLAVGAEWREERFRDKRSQDQLLNQSTPVTQSKGTRRVQAAYAEVKLPLTGSGQKLPLLHTLELNLAGRAETYSDAGFDHTAVPKLGLRWQPRDEQITFRASWGKGYRAPSLAELYQPQTTSIVFNLADPLRAGKPGSNPNDTNTGTRQLVSGGNPELRPETSESFNYGVFIQPKFLNGLSLSLDYFKVEVEDRIGPPASAAIILANPTLFPGFVDRAAPTTGDIANNLPGELIRIRTVLGNFGTAVTEGLDVAVEYRLSTSRFGRFTARVAGSRVYHSIIRSRPDLAAVDVVNTYEVPNFRGSGSVAWMRGKLGAVITADYVSGFADSAPSTVRVKQQAITGLQLSYELPAATKVTLGVNNLFDRAPPRTASSTGYAESTNYFLPRFVYLDVTKKF
jgi:iron complex outermembrane receptor protein